MTRHTDDLPRMTANQRTALYYIHRHETKDFGVIIRHATAEALVRKGWAKPAHRRKYARESGVCLRLTDKGYKIIRMIEGTW